jgi:hypothetical protein
MQKSKHEEHELLVVQVRMRRRQVRGWERGRERWVKYHENIQSVIIESNSVHSRGRDVLLLVLLAS